MMMTREEELNMVGGGEGFPVFVGGATFDIGDRVISNSSPELGVGTVVDRQYNRVWQYCVAFATTTVWSYAGDLQLVFF